MNTRTTLALAAAAGLPLAAQAQEVFQAVYSWQEVIANTTAPVALPNSVVDPGEGARIRIQANALINGASAIGQTSSYANPAPGGVGTIRGLGKVLWDLIGDDNAATANGVWASLQGPAAPLTSGGTPGTVQPGGSSIHGFGGLQFILPGQTANGANNVQAMRGVWTPNTYSTRTVNFLARLNVTVPSGQGASVLLCYGYSTIYLHEEPVTYDLLITKQFGLNAGAGLNIPVVPSPSSSLVLMGLVSLAAHSRQRGPRVTSSRP